MDTKMTCTTKFKELKSENWKNGIKLELCNKKCYRSYYTKISNNPNKWNSY